MSFKKSSPHTLATSSTSYRHKSNTKNVIYDDEEAELTQCGACGWRPKCLQMFASPFYFMLVMSLVGIFQGLILQNF